MTDKASKKCASLLKGNEQVASLVIGFSEEEFATFQAEGKVRILSKEASDEWKAYIDKYPTRSKGRENPSYVLLEFTPTWWSYNNIQTTPAVKISSDNSYTK
jgi:general stress protein 26